MWFVQNQRLMYAILCLCVHFNALMETLEPACFISSEVENAWITVPKPLLHLTKWCALFETVWKNKDGVLSRFQTSQCLDVFLKESLHMLAYAKHSTVVLRIESF